MAEGELAVGGGYWTPERIMMRDMARKFAQEEVTPIANKLDPEQGDMPRSLIRRLGELGFLGILIPEEHGGLGLGAFEYCLVAEELSRGWMSVASVLARANTFYKSIPSNNNAEWKAKVQRMLEGDYLGAGALSEPQTGSDLSGVATRARREGNEWVITGNKYWCTFADGADCIIVLCKIDDPTKTGKAGTVLVPVEKPKGELPNNCTGAPIPKIGYFGWKTWELRFEGTRAPYQEDPERNDGRGFQSAAKMLHIARAHTAARSIGLAQAALDHAIGYAKERIQFGRPISDFQAIRFKIATMASQIEACRQLNYHCCAQLDSLGPDEVTNSALQTSMVKYLAAEMSEKVTSEALQILGGAGYTTLHPVERYWRDARLTKIFEGTSEIQQRIISDIILGKPTKRGDQ